jgi:hypothetical protein
MATIELSAKTKRESAAILSVAYKADRSSAYSSNKTAVSGSSITAIWQNGIVRISSGFYEESTLKSMFNK